MKRQFLKIFGPTQRVALAFTLLCATGASVLAQVESAVDPVPRAGDWWTSRHESFNKNAASMGEDVKLLMIGDSITQGWEGAGASVWKAYYADRGALNLGIGGDRTQHVLWRLQNGNIEGLSPELAVIMIGTNNSGPERNSAGEIVAGVDAIVAYLREQLPEMKILLLGIFPRGAEFNDQRGKIAQVNQVLSAFPHRYEDLTYLDIGGSFLSVDGTIPPALMPDYLHFSTPGYGVWAAAMETSLASLLGDAPKKIANAEVGGDWTFIIDGPDGEVEMPFSLEPNGAMVSGSFQVGPDRELAVERGGVFGSHIEFQVDRDRPNGGQMLYRLKGVVSEDHMEGTVSTKIEGQETTSDWKAVRR